MVDAFFIKPNDMNFQIRKEVRILFVLGILLCFPINLLRANLNTIEKTINTIVGSSFTLNPWSDAKSKMSGAICSSTYCNSTDISAFTINAINKTITRYPNYNNQYREGFYYSYRVEALKAGVYTINASVNCNKKSGIDLIIGHFDIVYHVVVTEKPEVTSISIPGNLTLTLGNSYTFSPVILEEGASTTLSWSSNNPSCVSVTSGGGIKALSVGSAVIKCTASNGVSAQCVVTVNPVFATGISLAPRELTLEKGDKQVLTATVTPANATIRQVAWKSSDSNVALVGTDGTVMGVGVGQAMVTATTTDGSNLSATCMIEVKPVNVPATSIKLSQTELSLTSGDTRQLLATVYPSDVTNGSVAWSASNDCVSVDEYGNLTARKAGTAVVTATTMDGTNLSTSCHVTVSEKDVSAFDNIVYFEPHTVVAGQRATLPLLMNNQADITAIQFDLTLPQGVEIAKKADGQTYDVTFNEVGRTDESSHSISCALQDNGSVRVLCYSTALAVFDGNQGAILDLALDVADHAETGTHRISIDNIVLTDKNENKYALAHYSSVLKVVTTTPGDPNADGVTDVADIVAIAHYILGSPTDTFVKEAADLNGDGAIDVADIVAVAHKILGSTTRRLMKRSAMTQETAAPNFEITPFAMQPGEKSNTVTLDLYNPGREITAFQLDLELPEGLSIDLNRRGTAYNLTFNTDANRTDASYHTLSSALLDNGDIRILCYSTALEIFWGEEGALVNIPLTADEDMAPGIYEFGLKNIVLTQTDETKITPCDYRGTIVIGNGGRIGAVKLHGTYRESTLKAFSEAFASNERITSIDLTEATVQNETKERLTTGNANTLLYTKEGQPLGNSQNVVTGDFCEHLVLADLLPFHAPKSFVAGEASYNREVPEAGWYSVCLPFAPTLDAGLILEKFTGADLEARTVSFDRETDPQSYKPYILKANGKDISLYASNVEIAATPDLISDGIFIGTLKGIQSPEIDGFYALSPDGTGFSIASETAYAPAFRAVINAQGHIRLSIIHHGQATGIAPATVSGNAEEGAIYNLQGIQVEKPGKGIFIRNGKKFIQK